MDKSIDNLSNAESEMTSATDDELQIISSRAAEIQRQFRSELKSLDEKRKHSRRKPKQTDELNSSTSSISESSSRLFPKMDIIQSDLNSLNQLLANRIQETTAERVSFARPKSALSQSYHSKYDQVIENEDNETMTALDDAIQKSLERIKRNMRIKGDDDFTESSSTILDRTKTPVNEILKQPAANQGQVSNNIGDQNTQNLTSDQFVSAIRKEKAEFTDNLEHENFKRRVNLLKYELEAEQKSSSAKITVLSEELKTNKGLLDQSSRKIYELEQELSALNERLEVEIGKNFELNQTLKNKVGYLVNEIDNFKVFERDVEKKLEEKSKKIDELNEENRQKHEENESLKEAYAKQLSSLKDDLAAARSKFERNVNNLSEQNRVERENLIANLNKRHDTTIKLLRNKMEDEKEILDDEIKNLKMKLKERDQEHDSELRKQKNDFDDKIEARLTHERSLTDSEKEEALRRQQMKYEAELDSLRKRLNDDIDAEKRRGMESDRIAESLRAELASAKEDIANLQRESVEAIKETQRACEAASDMKISQLKEEWDEERVGEGERVRGEMQGVIKDKQTADLDVERLTNKVAELESNKMREQKRVLGRINKAIFDISASIGIQPRQVFLGAGVGGDMSTSQQGNDSTSILGGGGAMSYDLLVKSGLDNLSATAVEVVKHSKDHEYKLQQIREQLASYQAQRDMEVADTKNHLEKETDRMIEFAKERLYQKYIRDLDELRNEIRRDNDIESALRKTVDRQHTALKSMMHAGAHKRKPIGSSLEGDESTDTVERNRRNIRRLHSLNTKITDMAQH
ncbi:meiosis-specific nuclear structural protein 1-like [Symsagittifera roscoffensis]|uniref:meiosis-specific nuclear structural protein 1-like n=1 Tax=Symsagittifera roscoffensis TaxID=84072 RepID=UPI00307C2AC9